MTLIFASDLDCAHPSNASKYNIYTITFSFSVSSYVKSEPYIGYVRSYKYFRIV